MKLLRYQTTPPYEGYIITLYEYDVIKETTCGYWIKIPWAKKLKFVLKNSTKKFAYTTKEEAFMNYQLRTEKYIEYLKSQLDGARQGIEACKNYDINNPPEIDLDELPF